MSSATLDSPEVLEDSATTKPVRKRPERDRHVTDFIKLTEQVRAAGLMERDIKWYVTRIVRQSLGYLAVFALFLTLGQSWWQLVTAVLFAFMCTHTAFLSHDAAHRQVFASAKKNAWLARIAGNLFVGLSYGWWMNKHGKHHLNPNKIGVDGDIDPGALVFDPDSAAKRKGFAKWFAARQGYFFFPLLTLAALDLHFSAVGRVLDRKQVVPQRKTEIAFLFVRLVVLPAFTIWYLGWAIGLAFIAVQIMALGLYMGGSFAPNHKGMPLVPKDVKIDFMRRQTLMSRNISGGWWVDAGMGGLNYQIEHHLFPTMSSKNLKAVQPMVIKYCAERDITYTETTLWSSYMIVMRYLNRVGLGQRDPFECPVTANFRSAR
ncbi:fatty acid desaturase [Arthrobacter stackebrandtii]|uniref:Fatty acid desaturase n=1 Tax=Arthrobacter stackebrandtii TaxID=272161 RepID=A0ABS4YXU6_9MICC|nr:acyl-CoA desaturase [Arthrobacter stackebrandtii]MBP2413262.1 fatty acid desaturase [Arthrobacter stackebrandtii]PYH00995.1 acyl-CoA desaturase [Arthrobacter stackebrandtii]